MRHPFLRTLAGRQDPYFKNTTLLLHGDGTNGGQNNTFIDSSANAFAITRNGNTTQGTFSPYGDNWSNYFDGTGDYLRLPSSSAFSIATSTTPFTIECWIYPAAAGGCLFSEQFTGGSNKVDIVISMSSTSIDTTNGRTIRFGYYTGSAWVAAATASSEVSLHSWTHVACVFTGSTTKIFLNGVDSTAASPTPATTWGSTGSSGNEWYIGKRWDDQTGAFFTGYISNCRFVNGTAVYAAAFTPPTTPLTAITNTSLLTCQSNRFRDASTNNFTITRNGDVSVRRFSPFSPTAAYAAGTIGGSGYFDGTTDYLSASSNAAFAFGTGDFTIECFFYPTSTDTTQFLYVLDSTGGICFGFEPVSGVASLVLSRRATAYDLSAAYTIVPFQWLHLVAVRSGTTCSLYINGTRIVTGTNSLNYTVSGPVNVGTISTVSGYEANGYISNLRVVKGTAAYDPTQTTLTVPTAPLTAITNTSLLLNFTNAAILDNAMMAVPETAGNAQISTSVKKYGTGSLYFDGNGDYISLPKSNLLDFGAGDFTVEFWYYGVGSGDGILFLSGNSNSYAGFRMADGYLLLSSNGGGWITTSLNWTAPSAGLWTHYAATRSGSSIMVFLNGVLTKSFTTSESLYSAGTQYTVGRYQENASTYYYTNGYIDDLRITKGVARYTSNFIPPTAPFPDF